MEGSALRGDMLGGAKPAELTVKVESEAPAETVARLIRRAEASSPAHAVMRDVLNNTFSLTHNDRDLPVSDVRASEAEDVAAPSSDDGRSGAPKSWKPAVVGPSVVAHPCRLSRTAQNSRGIIRVECMDGRYGPTCGCPVNPGRRMRCLEKTGHALVKCIGLRYCNCVARIGRSVARGILDPVLDALVTGFSPTRRGCRALLYCRAGSASANRWNPATVSSTW